VALVCTAPQLCAAQQAPNANSGLSVIDEIVRKSIANGETPGAVIVVGHNGSIVYRKAFGNRSVEPTQEPMTVDTIFDIASLTKCLATGLSVMRLVQDGSIRLNDPVVKYIPEFGRNGKEEITIRQLLTHYSGLRPDLDLDTPWQGYDEAMRRIYAEKPVSPPGSRFAYSDINFEILGELVRRVSGMPLDQFAARHFYQPLGMQRTRFNPPSEWRPQIAPTQYENAGLRTPVGEVAAQGGHEMLRGVVHDPTARRMGGVAGHAGLFSTADDLARLAQALLNNDGSVLSPAIVQKMITPQQPAGATQVRGLAWDLDSVFASNRGELLPVGSYGHTGFTGTSLWIDPATRTFIIILANAVHPNGKGSVVALRTRIATAVAAHLQLTADEQEQVRLASITGYNETMVNVRRMSARNGAVLNGIDVLEASGFAQLKGGSKRAGAGDRIIGVLTNNTGLDLQGRRTIDILAHVPGLKLAAIFSPEHGITGALDTSAVGDAVDAATGVPVYSVYGSTDAARRPSLDALRKLDAVVIDIQDVGVRFYTYETTLGYFLEAAAKTRSLNQHSTVGEAMHSLRMHLLRDNNLLGLAYSAYCSAQLRMETLGS
jgi:CubicO group peptidase (beta-lactamase class C family)